MDRNDATKLREQIDELLSFPFPSGMYVNSWTRGAIKALQDASSALAAAIAERERLAECLRVFVADVQQWDYESLTTEEGQKLALAWMGKFHGMKAERDRDAKDARRYRWLRDNVTEELTDASLRGCEHSEHKTRYALPMLISWADFCGPITLDEAIDYKLDASNALTPASAVVGLLAAYKSASLLMLEARERGDEDLDDRISEEILTPVWYALTSDERAEVAKWAKDYNWGPSK